MPSSARKWVARLIQAALLVAAIAFVANWTGMLHFGGGHSDRHISAVGTPPDSLGPGDLRIYNADSSVDLMLVGDKLWAGLSPKTVERVRAKLDSSSRADSGLRGSIEQLVKKSVAGAIDTHAEFPLAQLRDMRYENGRLVFEWKSGSTHSMFDDVTVNDKRESDTFRQADAEQFIAAVHARQSELRRMVDSTGRAKANTGAGRAPQR